MNIVRLGTEYGGWAFDLDNINNGDVILDCGVGNDVSFAEELLKLKDVKFVFVDPEEDDLDYARSRVPNAVYVQGAVTKQTGEVDLFLSKTGGSHSLMPEMSIVGKQRIKVNGIKLEDLLKQYSPNIVKLDIEGSEYEVFEDLLLYNAKQIAIEFHHRFIPNLSQKDTDYAIFLLEQSGYTQIYNDGLDGITFLRS